jgi:hypothetical protein
MITHARAIPDVVRTSNQLFGEIQYDAAEYITWSRNIQFVGCFETFGSEVDASDSDYSIS